LMVRCIATVSPVVGKKLAIAKTIPQMSPVCAGPAGQKGPCGARKRPQQALKTL
jgi:hypothetical protein